MWENPPTNIYVIKPITILCIIRCTVRCTYKHHNDMKIEFLQRHTWLFTWANHVFSGLAFCTLGIWNELETRISSLTVHVFMFNCFRRNLVLGAYARSCYINLILFLVCPVYMWLELNFNNYKVISLYKKGTWHYNYIVCTTFMANCHKET